MIARAAAAGIAAQPVIWTLLGYQFEAASMLAGLCACIVVRLWVSLNNRSSRLLAWAIDLTVTAISLLFTAGWIVLQRPAPFYALLTGTGFGALGASIIAVSLAWIRRFEPAPSATLSTSDMTASPVPRERPNAGEDR